MEVRLFLAAGEEIRTAAINRAEELLLSVCVCYLSLVNEHNTHQRVYSSAGANSPSVTLQGAEFSSYISPCCLIAQEP